MNAQGNSARDRLARLLEAIPDEWLVDLVPLLFQIVAVVRRFFGSPGDASVRLSVGTPLGGAVVGSRPKGCVAGL
jgi:hypothetical protein